MALSIVKSRAAAIGERSMQQDSRLHNRLIERKLKANVAVHNKAQIRDERAECAKVSKRQLVFRSAHISVVGVCLLYLVFVRCTVSLCSRCTHPLTAGMLLGWRTNFKTFAISWSLHPPLNVIVLLQTIFYTHVHNAFIHILYAAHQYVLNELYR